MKKNALIIVFALLTINATFSQNEQKATEEAIITVIENESKYFWKRDLKNWKKTWLHKPYISWTVSSKDGVRQYHGWNSWLKEIKTLFKESPEPMPYDGKVIKKDYQFRVYGDGAWVSFIQTYNGEKTLETRIMEKEKDKWKIAMVSVIFDVNEADEMVDSNQK